MATRRRTPWGKVYSLVDFDDPAIVRYSGDPDEFTALAHAWLADQIEQSSLYFDWPIAIAPPEPRWFRMNPYPGDDYSWSLGFPSGPGRGNWLGSYLKVIRIGCSQCRHLHGAHGPDCLNDNVVELETCQVSVSGLRRSNQMIHLVRVKDPSLGDRGGRSGSTLCEIDRFSPGVSFSMGGGYTVTGIRPSACYMCARVAKREFPDAPVDTGMREFAQAFLDAGLKLGPSWAGLTPTAGYAARWALAK